VLRTDDAASPVPAASVATTLVLFVLIYLVVFSFGIYFINRLIARWPQDAERDEAARQRLAAGHPSFGY
jgi:cytochrome d ubiquinol oxidase subunit I